MAVALVVIAGSQLVSTVGATGNTTITRRVARLESKVKILLRRVNALKANAACENAVVSVARYGNPPASQGYLFTPDGVNAQITTALDLARPGAGVWVPVVTNECVSQARAS